MDDEINLLLPGLELLTEFVLLLMLFCVIELVKELRDRVVMVLGVLSTRLIREFQLSQLLRRNKLFGHRI